ncbi:MAG TPA: M1 family metallopeptidase [Herpetosiphonaceae bacterium]
MQRRTIWIVVGAVATVLLLMCVIVASIGFYLVRQQQQVADVFATISAGLEATVEAQQVPMGTPLATTGPSDLDDQPATPAPDATQATPRSSATPTASVDLGELGDAPDADVAASLVASSRDTLNNHPDASRYRISAVLDPQGHTISGAQAVRLTNTEDTALSEIYFRLYVNAPHYNEGEITVEDVQIDGAAAQTSLEVNDTALKIALPQPLQTGQSIEVGMRFTTTVPDSGGGYGIFNESNGIFTLYNWHPEVAVYEKGGWLLNPVSDQGDPTNTDAANYEVTFAAPHDVTVVTSGVNVEQERQADRTAHTFVAALARNFVVVAGEQLQSASQDVGGVTIRSYFLPESAQGGRAALQTAARSIELFGKEFGPYPYKELDVVEVELGGGAAGMESTGLIMIGSEYYDPETAAPLARLGGTLEGIEGADILAFTTAHEVAHQWWYGIVGSDAYKQPWLDESLTNWSSAFYVDQAVGDDAGKIARDLFIGVPYRVVLGEGDRRLDQPVESFDDQEYGAIVYGKGALMYDVLRQELGDEKFFAFLRRYYQEQQFDRADSDEWLQTLNQVAGQDMTAFYRKWVEGAAIQPSDLPPGGPLSELFSGRLENLLRRPNRRPPGNE